MIGKSQSAGTCDDRAESELAKLVLSFLKKICKCFLDICKMSLVIGEYKIIIFVSDRDLDSGGTNVNSKCVFLHIKLISSLLYIYKGVARF